MGASRVMYDGKRIIPAPLVTFSKNYQTTGDGEKVGSLFSISIQGTILSFKGSPDSSGSLWTAGGYPNDGRSEPTYLEDVDGDSRLASIFRKQETIRELFSVDGLQLEWQSADGSAPIKCNPRVLSIEFPQDIWYQTSTYTITLEADVLYVNGQALGEDDYPNYISSASESWSFETDEANPESTDLNRTYRLTHTVSAVGKRFYDDTGALSKPAWQQARDWVFGRLGFDATIGLSSGVNNLPDYYGGFNHVRNEQTDEAGGNYSVTETWILSSGTALEDFTIDESENLDQGTSTVGIQGTIRGLEEKDSEFNITSTKYDNANSKWAVVEQLLHNRAQTYSGKTLNSSALNTTLGRNPAQGTITYNYQFDTRPSNYITDAKSETIAITDSVGVDVFAAVGVLGRAAGPVLQDIGTKREATRNLTIELVFGPEYTSGTPTQRLITGNPRVKEPQATEIAAIVSTADPVLSSAINNAGQFASTEFVSNKSESWDYRQGRYSFQIDWVYE